MNLMACGTKSVSSDYDLKADNGLKTGIPGSEKVSSLTKINNIVSFIRSYLTKCMNS